MYAFCKGSLLKKKRVSVRVSRKGLVSQLVGLGLVSNCIDASFLGYQTDPAKTKAVYSTSNTRLQCLLCFANFTSSSSTNPTSVAASLNALNSQSGPSHSGPPWLKQLLVSHSHISPVFLFSSSKIPLTSLLWKWISGTSVQGQLFQSAKDQRVLPVTVLL